jgi:hypothetical protein
MCMGLPESSLRGFCIGRAGRAADGSEVVAKVRWELRCFELFERTISEAGEDLLGCLKAAGARKLR